MTIWQLIRTMLQKGFLLETGPHFTNYRGYWAKFTPTEVIDNAPECEECGEPVIFDRWDAAGHAMTAQRAVVMAAKIALKKSVAVPSCEEFQL